MYNAILLSGGIDSTALAYWKKPAFGLTINYGQLPAVAEIRAAEAVCKSIGIEHIVINVDCSDLGSGDLSKNKTAINIAPSTEWWPYRNQLLVTLAAMKAIEFNISKIMLASVKSDGFHKDGTPEFYHLINKLLNFQEGAIEISAPAIEYTSHELVIKSGVSSEILFFAHSCHTSNIPCGHCPGCSKYINVIQSLIENGY